MAGVSTQATNQRDGLVEPSSATTIGGYLIERPACAWGRSRFRDSGRLYLGHVQVDRAESDSLGGDDSGRQRRLRGGRVCEDQRVGLRGGDVLRRRAELLQQHRRGIRGEVAGGCVGGFAGDEGAGAEPAVASQSEGFRDAVGGVREDHGRIGGVGRPVVGVRRDRPGVERGDEVQTAGLS